MLNRRFVLIPLEEISRNCRDTLPFSSIEDVLNQLPESDSVDLYLRKDELANQIERLM
jgi:hypothetical protein